MLVYFLNMYLEFFCDFIFGFIIKFENLSVFCLYGNICEFIYFEYNKVIYIEECNINW